MPKKLGAQVTSDFHVKFYVTTILVKMKLELSFRRRLQNYRGYYLVSIPPAVAKSLNCTEVDLIVGADSIYMVPVREV